VATVADDDLECTLAAVAAAAVATVAAEEAFADVEGGAARNSRHVEPELAVAEGSADGIAGVAAVAAGCKAPLAAVEMGAVVRH